MPKKEEQEISIRKNLLIPMKDGVELAGDLYIAEQAGGVPCLVSYYPYRKDDWLGAALDYSCRYFARHGYAHLVVDFRGTGNSEGMFWETCDPRENEDGAEVVEWAARQEWCDGNVGMWGISYGGVSSLEAASERPPHLKAIAPVFASIDPYHDLIYPGGCLNCLTMYGDWGTEMVASVIMPPGYQDPDGRWYRVWKERLESIRPHALSWQDHPTFDKYWQSRIIPLERIQVPTFLVGAWRDIFPQAMVRAYERIQAPKKLVMGPWTHAPMDLYPEETWDFQRDLKRWFDHWLKREANSIVVEPPVTIYVQGEKRWRNEPEWPIARTENRKLYLAQDRKLDRNVPGPGSVNYRADPTVGVMAGLWDPNSRCIGLPLDQGPDDLSSATFTTDPLNEAMEITGSPEFTLCFSLEKGDEVHLVAKLNDVGQDGSSSLITTGWLKGTLRDSQERPSALRAGEVYKAHMVLWATSYLVPKGHQLRLSVACADFPHIWPSRTNPEIRLFFGGDHDSSLRLPVIPPARDALPQPKLPRPAPEENRHPYAIDGAPYWRIERDLVKDEVAVVSGAWAQTDTPHGGMKVRMWDTKLAAIAPRSRPDGVRLEGQSDVEVEVAALGKVKVEARTLASLDRFLATGRVFVNGQLFFQRTWRG